MPEPAPAAYGAGDAPRRSGGRGRFVYRCERQGDWLAIMFPGLGETVDCSQRPPTRGCPTGWVQGDVTTAIFG
jgi:hypothetical protein